MPAKSLRPYLLLTRISLAPSAVMDAMVGLAIGSLLLFPGWLAVLTTAGASLCVFLGGMALNDWADREADAKTRPERPIPSGQIQPNEALAFAIGLLALGTSLGFLLGPLPGFTILGVALVAGAYDTLPRGPWLGPICLATCRAGNLSFATLAGLGILDRPIEFATFLPAIGYGLYVLVLSRLSPYEDGVRPIEDNAPGKLLLLAAIILALLPMTAFALRPQPSGTGYSFAFLISVGAAFGLFKMYRETPKWNRGMVGRAMGMCLRRLMLATAALSCMAWHDSAFAYIVTAFGFLGMKFSHVLRKHFPPS